MLINLFVLVCGDVCQQLVKRGEDKATARLLALMQVATMLFLNLISLSFVLVTFLGTDLDVFVEGSRYQRCLWALMIFSGIVFILHKGMARLENIESLYADLLVKPNGQGMRVAAKAFPYLTLSILVLVMIIYISL